MKKKGRLLDTDIVIYWLKGVYPGIDEKMNELGFENVSVSSITVAELYYGAFNSTRKDENIRTVDELVSEIPVIDYDEKSGRVFGEIKAELKRKGKILSDSDLFIASTALSHDLILVSNNERHFSRIARLRHENWI